MSAFPFLKKLIPKNFITLEGPGISILSGLIMDRNYHHIPGGGIPPEGTVQSPELLQSILDASINGVIALEAIRNEEGLITDFRILFFNEVAKVLLQRDIKYGDRVLQLVPGIKVSGLFDKYIKLLQSGNKINEEFYYPYDGFNSWLHLIAVRVNADRVVCTFTDITERKGKEEEHRKDVSLLKQSEEISKMGTWDYDIGLDRMEWSKGMYDLFHLEPGASVYPERYLEFIVPKDRKRADRFLAALRNGSKTIDETFTLSVEGKRKIVKIKGTPFKDETGKVIKMLGVDIDITEKKEAERKIKEQHYFLNQVIEATPDVINIYDLTTKSYIYISKELYALLGYTSEQIKKMSQQEIQELIYSEDLPEIAKFYEDILNSKSDEIFEIEHRVKNSEGKWGWFKRRSKVFKRNGQGEVTQIISIVQDYAQKKEAEDKLRENEVMRLLLQKKDEFMSIATHELRTPISTLKASLQILHREMERKADEKVLFVFLDKSIMQINKLIAMISDLMDNSKIQSGKMTLSLSEFDMGTLIAEAISHNYTGYQIIVHNTVTEPVEADKMRLEQVLINFLNNAVKYSGTGTEIIINVTREGDFVKVAVRDFGIGIPADKLPYIFDRFFRVEVTSAKFSGLGLGLYICAEIINLHHGTYGVERQPGEGSNFWFMIPRRVES